MREFLSQLFRNPRTVGPTSLVVEQWPEVPAVESLVLGSRFWADMQGNDCVITCASHWRKFRVPFQGQVEIGRSE